VRKLTSRVVLRQTSFNAGYRTCNFECFHFPEFHSSLGGYSTDVYLKILYSDELHVYEVHTCRMKLHHLKGQRLLVGIEGDAR